MPPCVHYCTAPISLAVHSQNRELAALRERLTTLGYQDGVEDGVQKAVQEGFDQGYAAGAVAGWNAGLLYGGAAAAAAALAASHERLAEVGGEGMTFPDKADVTARTGDEPKKLSAGLAVDSRTSVEGGGGDSAATTTLPGATFTLWSHEQLVESDGKKAVGVVKGLQGLVEELKRASLSGPDGPGAPDRADVLRRLRLAGPAGAAVADGLDKRSPTGGGHC